MSSKKSRVLVLGAGVGGLTVAIGLIKRGAQVDVVEKKIDNIVYGVGLSLPGNACARSSRLICSTSAMPKAWALTKRAGSAGMAR